MGRRKVYEETHLDKSTGEVTIVQKAYSVKSSTPEEFFLTFLSGVNAIQKLTRPSDLKVLSILCSRAEYNTGQVSITSTDRKEIMEQLGINSPQSFTNSIARLKKEKLVSGERGSFIVNPEYFWKGTTNERNKVLKDKTFDLFINFKHES